MDGVYKRVGHFHGNLFVYIISHITITGYETKTASALHAYKIHQKFSVVSRLNNACPYPEPALTHLRWWNPHNQTPHRWIYWMQQTPQCVHVSGLARLPFALIAFAPVVFSAMMQSSSSPFLSLQTLPLSRFISIELPGEESFVTFSRSIAQKL